MDHQTWAIEGPHGAMGCDVRGVVVIVGLEKLGPLEASDRPSELF